MNSTDIEKRHLYWLGEEDFQLAKVLLTVGGYSLSATLLTPCQVLRSRGRNLVYARPGIWSGICARQGSWYRDSERRGQFMVMSDHRLPAELDRFLDSEMAVSDFVPEQLPDEEQLGEIVASEEYQSRKPKEWEGIWLKDSIMFKILFSVTRFWGRGDSLKKYWLQQKANHANFLARKVTTELDGEQVPYSVSENAGVCSSCAEFFNVFETSSRKLVRSCPGAVTFGGAKRDIYYDIKPAQSRSGEQ
jgi:hypothetical protein